MESGMAVGHRAVHSRIALRCIRATAYDPAGRLQSKTRRGDGASTRYTWDARGRLIGQTLRILHDGDRAVRADLFAGEPAPTSYHRG